MLVECHKLQDPEAKGKGKSNDNNDTRHMGTNLDTVEEIARQKTFMIRMQEVAEWLNGCEEDDDPAIVFVCRGGKHRSEAMRFTTVKCLEFLGALTSIL